ncbi:uncharacterized protein LOC125229758 [Leguminivora glycinivorella]|uniref:uncharacterized protein LOC125229758 n=1 Tax=Leguminivora glycinivorella TaxID=1035111 RepID=UPI00200F9D1E|nr:uncharacterized protein LOC125229758 [Leguminivora glycinivorella]
MDPEDQSSAFTSVVDSVMSLFGEVMTRDAVCAIVEHCGGDLTQAIDIIVNMSDDSSAGELSNNAPSPNQTEVSPHNIARYPTLPPTSQITGTTIEPLMNTSESLSVSRNSQIANMQVSQPRLSYSGASQTKGAFPKQLPKRAINPQISIWTPQTKQIVEYHKKGIKILILMRGLPGSGKSFLARELIEYMCPDMNHKSFIFSTDDFFMHRGRYEFQKHMLPEAHFWNQNRVYEAMGRDVSPIIIDNTNVEIRHMEPYVRAGVRKSYVIEVLEPNTPWAKKVGPLARKNSHDVNISTLKRLLDSFQECPNGAFLIQLFGLSYPAGKALPIIKNIPPLFGQDQHGAASSIQTRQFQAYSATSQPGNAFGLMSNFQNAEKTNEILQELSTTGHNNADSASNNACETQQRSHEERIIKTRIEIEQEKSGDRDATSNDNETGHNDNDPIHKVEFVKLEDVKKQLEEIEKLEEEWENGDAWNEESKSTAKSFTGNASGFVPKPPRNAEHNSTGIDRFLPTSSHYNDWSKISMFMPSWTECEPTISILDTPNIEVQTATKGTSVEFGDTEVNIKNLKVLIATPRDINFYYTGLNEEKIPNKRTLDKSSMTNDHDHIAVETVRCKNEEKHFIAFRKLFKNISKVELRDIFDKCVGDVNWAVDIVLDGMANNQLHTSTGDISDTEDVDDEQCDCLAAYNIIPNVNTQPKVNTPILDLSPTEVTPGTSGPSTPKLKKDKNLSESSIQLKRQIEQNVVISDSHYSNHCLKIRKMRRGEVDDDQGALQQETEDKERDSPIASTSTAPEPTADNLSDDDDSQTASSDDGERVVNVDLGAVFISELDNMFGRNDMLYPDNIMTRVNMPISLLNEINALWIESFMYQLDEQSRQSEIMLRQDEEFARQLALKEEQLAKAGEEPAVPDLKDIMDMELALSIYKKEITAEWRNNVPNDLAAVMTREKLYNLFPDVNPEVLSELLMAHDNNFQATVEVLLSSTGNAKILEEENGVTKFITTKELERHEKLIEEQKKALSEVEWPLLPKEDKVDMNTVQEYRAKANEHLEQRNLSRLRAESYLARNMPHIATYYSQVAVLHKKKFDHANSLAAASLMQVHAARNTDKSTIDLHFMRVLEARETLDLFLDSHIRRLRECVRGPRCHTLFFITGRGLHSPGGPVIKPATKRRLRERGIAYTERNPGLLTSRVCAEDKLTHEFQ